MLIIGVTGGGGGVFSTSAQLFCKTKTAQKIQAIKQEGGNQSVIKKKRERERIQGIFPLKGEFKSGLNVPQILCEPVLGKQWM